MRKIWFGLAYAAFAAVIAEPAPAQDHQKNFVECTKELGLQIDPNALIPFPDRFEWATASSPLSKHRSPGSDSIQTDLRSV